MNVIVCLKQVPAATEVNINPETNTLVREGVKSMLNPFDAYALEEAVRIKERCSGKVTAISMGPRQAEEMLRESIACGADEAVLLSDPAFAGSDTLATSFVLARAITKIGQYDLIICGRQTIDGDTGQVGPELAERLGIPFVAYVKEIEEMREGYARVQRMIEEGYEVMEMPLPGAITVVKEINVPRLPSLRGMARARSAQIPVWAAQDLGVDMNKVGLAGSPTRVIRIFFPQRARRGQILGGSLEEQVDELVEKLRETKIG